MKFRPAIIYENFGAGFAGKKLDHITVSVQPFDEAVRDVILASKTAGLRLNWVDAKLPLRVVMRDTNGDAIGDECGDVTCCVHWGKVSILIKDKSGNSASFELGQADGLWPELGEDQA